MIPAHKFPLGQRLVNNMIDRSFRKYFDGIYLRSAEDYTAEKQQLPLIICANHSSWWDGYVASLVERHFGLDAYLMMEEAQLKRYFFFTWVGCFSVDRQNVRSALQSLQYAGKILAGHPERFVWMFPQGEIEPNDRRPLTFFNGAAYVARQLHAASLVPAAIRIEFLGEQRPALFISLGKSQKVSKEETQAPNFLKSQTHLLEQSVTAELDNLRADLIAGRYSDFTRIREGRSSTNRIFDKLLFRKQIGRKV